MDTVTCTSFNTRRHFHLASLDFSGHSSSSLFFTMTRRCSTWIMIYQKKVRFSLPANRTVDLRTRYLIYPNLSFRLRRTTSFLGEYHESSVGYHYPGPTCVLYRIVVIGVSFENSYVMRFDRAEPGTQNNKNKGAR